MGQVDFQRDLRAECLVTQCRLLCSFLAKVACDEVHEGPLGMGLEFEATEIGIRWVGSGETVGPLTLKVPA